MAVEYRAGATVSSQAASAGLQVDRMPPNGLSVYLTGTWSATVAVQVSHDNSAWVTPELLDGSAAGTKTGNGYWNLAGTFKYVRVNVNPYSSGDVEWGVLQ